MTEHSSPPAEQTPRLVVAWPIVLTPLAYGVIQTVKSILPLFGG